MSDVTGGAQAMLFATQDTPDIVLDDADLVFNPGFLPAAEADALFAQLQHSIDWQQQHLRMYGKTIAVPRLTAWHGDANASYTWSGIHNPPRPWTPPLQALRQRVAAATGAHYNSVLLNLYRDGKDSVDWHADDEAELGDNPVIASVSLGQSRLFQLRRTDDHTLRRQLELTHGSLLLMAGATQRHWQHRIPKASHAQEPRINLTFRCVI